MTRRRPTSEPSTAAGPSGRLVLGVAFACAYGAALTLNLFHHIGVEHHDGETPIGLLVLRDGTLALPVLAFVTALLLGPVLRRAGRVADAARAALLAAGLMGGALAATLAAAGPVHELLFGGHGHDHGLGAHVLLSFAYAAAATLPICFSILLPQLRRAPAPAQPRPVPAGR